MFTIVVPTMWKFERFISFLYDLVEHPLIGEIIIINNDPQNTPNNDILHCHHKINMVDFGHNIYVNPAWNWGVEHANHNKICIMNDDIIYDTKIFNRVNSYLNKDIGVIGVGLLPCNENFTDGMIRIIPRNKSFNLFGFGMLFFVHKESYVPVPEQLQMYFGDNFIHDNSIWRGKKVFIINDLFYYSPYGSTGIYMMDEMNKMFAIEKEHYSNIIKSVGLEPRVWCPEHYSE